MHSVVQRMYSSVCIFYLSSPASGVSMIAAYPNAHLEQLSDTRMDLRSLVCGADEGRARLSAWQTLNEVLTRYEGGRGRGGRVGS